MRQPGPTVNSRKDSSNFAALASTLTPSARVFCACVRRTWRCGGRDSSWSQGSPRESMQVARAQPSLFCGYWSREEATRRGQTNTGSASIHSAATSSSHLPVTITGHWAALELPPSRYNQRALGCARAPTPETHGMATNRQGSSSHSKEEVLTQQYNRSNTESVAASRSSVTRGAGRRETNNSKVGGLLTRQPNKHAPLSSGFPSLVE